MNRIAIALPIIAFVMVTVMENFGQSEVPILDIQASMSKNAVARAVAERDEAMLRQWLAKGAPFMHREIVMAVRNAWFQTFVPDLIHLLEQSKAMPGTTQAEITIREDYQNTVISALIHFTGLQFTDTRSLSPTHIETAIRMSREWYDENKTQIDKDFDAEIIERQRPDPILSKNYQVVKWALDKAVAERDLKILRAGLNGVAILSLKTKVAKAVADLGNESFVPDLLKALELNQGIMSGGTETQIEQILLDDALIETIAKLSGLKFKYHKALSRIDINGFRRWDRASSDEIKQIIGRTSKWLEAKDREVVQ